MANEQEYQNLFDRMAALRETLVGRLGSDLIQNPQLADALVKQIDDMLAGVVDADAKTPPPPDKGARPARRRRPRGGSSIRRDTDPAGHRAV